MDINEISSYRYDFEKFYQLVLLYIGVMRNCPHYYDGLDRAVYERNCGGFVDELQKMFLIPEMIIDAGKAVQTNLRKKIEA